MEGFDLPMSFGKKAPAKKNTKSMANVDKTQRVEDKPQTSNGARVGPLGPGPLEAKEDTEAGPSSSRKRPFSELDQQEPTASSSTHPQNGESSLDDTKVPQEDHDSDSDFINDDDDNDASAPTSTYTSPFPTSHEIILKDHSKVISALSIDSSGARIATASHDYDVKLWDFGGMNNRLKPFKSFEPAGSYHVHDVAFSPDNQSLLVISGTTQAKLYTREGEDGVAFNKGDPYIHDMRHTKGHVAELTSGTWHPRQSDEFITSSNDSTIRIWNTADRVKQKTVIVVKSKEKGARTKVTTCAYSGDGKMIAGACEDGTLHIWSTSSNMARPAQSCETAHQKYTETSGLVFSRDGRHLASRGGDDTVKLWDTRSMRRPLYTATDLPNIYPDTNIIFSPDDKYLLTGLAVKKGEGVKGEIVILNREGLTEHSRISIGEGSVVRVAWHSRINQIFATTSLGACHVLYNPTSSIHGALLPLSKMPRTASKDDVYVRRTEPVIITPHALPSFREGDYRESKRQKEKARNDPVKSQKPQEPFKGAGKGGRIGASATQHVVQSMFRNTTRDEDPREALLKYADKAGTEPMYTSAWTQNQPNAVFADAKPEDYEEKKAAPKPKQKK